MQLKAHSKNKAITPAVGISILHAGKNDYRVVIDGVGEYAQTRHLGVACTKMSHLAMLDRDNIEWVINAITTSNANVALTV
jgi:hypothetical protein